MPAQPETVRSAQTAVSAELYSGVGRLRGVHYTPAATAGTLVFKDGGASGTVLLTLNTPAGVVAPVYVPIPGDGISFGTDLYVVVTTTLFCTTFYGQDLG